MFFFRERKKRISQKDITDNRKFWKTAKLFPPNKDKSKAPIILVNNDNIESNEIEVGRTFN